LAIVFIHSDFQGVQSVSDGWVQFGSQLGRDPPCDFLGRGVRDGQQHAVFSRKDPSLVPESDGHFRILHFDFDHGMMQCQQHVVVELFHQSCQRFSKCNEVDHVSVVIQSPLDLGPQPIIMAMQTLADIPRKSDEVSGREKQLLFL
jgi:hypothetical protein